MSSRLVEAYLGSRVARGAAVAVPVLFVAWVWSWAPFTDIDVYRIGAQVWLDGGDLYGPLPPSEKGVGLPFTYPPLSAVLFSVLTLLPREAAVVVFAAASVAALHVSVTVLIRALSKWSWRDACWLAVAVTGLGVMLEPMVATLRLGQINTMLLLLVVVDLVLGRGRWWRGSLIGLAMAIKLTPAVFLAYLLVRRDWRGLAMGIGSALVYTAVGFLAAPSESVRYWTATLRDPARIGTLSYVSNQSLNGLLVRFGLDGGARTAVWFGLCAALGLFLLWVMHRLIRQGREVAAWSLMGIYSLLASPVSWSHHWVWTVPALAVVFAWAGRSWVALAVGVVGVLLQGTYAIWRFPADDDRELSWGFFARIVGNGYVWWGLAYVAFATWVAVRGRPAVTDEGDAAQPVT